MEFRNFCARYSDVVLRGLKWRLCETSAVYSGRSVLRLSTILLDASPTQSKIVSAKAIQSSGFVKVKPQRVICLANVLRDSKTSVVKISITNSKQENLWFIKDGPLQAGVIQLRAPTFTFEFSSSPCIFSVLQYSDKWHTFYKITLPVYLRDYLSKADLELNARS